MDFKQTKTTLSVLAATMITGAILASNSALADDDHKHKKALYTDNCQFLPLVNNPQNPASQTVCVDAPVALTKVKAIFDMTQAAPENNKPHTGLRHMGMLAQALMGRINNDLINPKDISIVGVIHGSSAVKSLALANSNDNSETKKLIDNIFGLKKKGVNINLEICGVTLNGMKQAKTAEILAANPDMDPMVAKAMVDNGMQLYSNEALGGVIHVNQGAIGRMIDLQQRKYTLIKE